MAKFVGNFTEAMKNYTEEKLKKLENRGINYRDARVKLQFISEGCALEISVENKLRARKKGPSDEFYSLVIDVVDCLIKQTDRYNKYISRKHPNNIVVEEPMMEEETAPKNILSREKTIYAEGMSFDDAVEEMEALGHSFYVYRDIDLKEDITIVYRRDDGTYGTIQCK